MAWPFDEGWNCQRCSPGFAAMKAGLFEAEAAPGEPGGKDVEGDVGGVLLMMAERGDGVLGGGHAVRIGGGAYRRVADGRGVEAQQRPFAEPDIVERAELHEEVVRVLAVDDGLAEGGLALLEELRVLAVGDGSGFEREHRPQRELTGADLAHRHGHDPVGGKNLSPPRPVELCCWVSAMKPLPCSMSIQPERCDMSLYIGVEAGSTLVPELTRLS